MLFHRKTVDHAPEFSDAHIPTAEEIVCAVEQDGQIRATVGLEGALPELVYDRDEAERRARNIVDRAFGQSENPNE